jgi:HJR/Mrr/RecB family endonuclease
LLGIKYGEIKVFGIIAKLFKQDNGIEKLEERFLSDYLNNELFFAELEPHVKDNVVEEVEGLYQSYKEQSQPYYIFKSIQLLHAVKWLSYTGYGGKLRSKLDRLNYKDDYGDLVIDDSRAELNRFVEKRLYSMVHAIDGTIDNYYITLARSCECENSLLIQWADENEFEVDDASGLMLESSQMFQNHDVSNVISEFDSNDPYEYERYVAEVLCSLGWNAHATRGSGDQGADVIAEKDNLKLIVQCKLYGQPVGNKAVQEVASAERYFGGNVAVVISNNDFTKSARQLADSLGVYLLHHAQLGDLDSLLFESLE